MRKRPICIGAVFLVTILLLGRLFGVMETSPGRLPGSSYMVSEKSVRVLGQVKAREETGSGIRLYLNHISFNLKSDQTNNSKTNQSSENQNSQEQNQQKFNQTNPKQHGQKNSGQRSLKQKNQEQLNLREQSLKQPNQDQQNLKQEYQILVYLNPMSQQKYADQIQVGNWLYLSGLCSLPEQAGNPGQFDARQYYLPRKVLFILKNARVLRLMDTGESYPGILAKIRGRLQVSYELVLGEKDAGIISAITLGDRSALPKEIKNIYTEGGIAHILAISSLHITLLGMGLYRLLRRWRISFAAAGVISGGFIFSFCLMTGMSASACRACVMYLLWLGSQITGRTNDRLTSLAVSAVFILLRAPEYLWDGSFLLSFGCILSLHFLIPLMERLFPVPGKPGRALQASFAVFLGTTPVVMYFFYQITPYSILVNLIVIPCMTLLMASGLAGCIAGLCSVPLGTIAAAPCHYLLVLFEWLCREERKLPGAVLITGRPSLFQIILYYLVLAGMYLVYVYRGSGKQGRSLRGRRHIEEQKNGVKSSNRKRHRIAGGWFLMAASLAILFWRVSPELRIVFLDVGQGDGILIQSGRAAFLIDGGSSSVSDVWQYRIEPAMKYYGISRLDGVFLSHGDQDHMNGAEQLLETYERDLMGHNMGGITVEQIFLADTKDEKMQLIRQAAADRNIPVRSFPQGASISAGKMKLTCLYPDGQKCIGAGNENSMVLLLEQGDFSGLFTGDLEGRGEAQFLEICGAGEKGIDPGMLVTQPGQIKFPENGLTVLKVGHHGSKNGTSQIFLDLLHPKMAVISCGENNRYHHPSPETLARLEKEGTDIYRTDQDGAVIITISGDGQTIRKYRVWQ